MNPRSVEFVAATDNCHVSRHEVDLVKSLRFENRTQLFLKNPVSSSDVIFSDESGNQMKLGCDFVVWIVRYSDE